MNTLVSLIIRTFNNEKTILRSLNSALRQSYTNLEVILVNDGSTDKTLNQLKKVNLKNIKFSILSYKKNLGKSAALKKGIKKSNNNIIVFYDCDLPYFKYLKSQPKSMELKEEFI